MTEIDWKVIPSDIAETYRLRAEKERLRKARYEYTRPGRKHHGNQDSGAARKIKALDKDFVVWDGEGPRDTGYSLFGNSLGMEICHPWLETEECLQLIMDTEEHYPDCIHVWFGGNYDVSNILRQLSWRHLTALHKWGRCVWKDWEIEHIPHKWLMVKHGQIVAKIYDVRTFFAGGLVSVLEEWGIGPWKTAISTPDDIVLTSVPSLDIVSGLDETSLVRTFKKLRGSFLWKDITQIRIYMRLELKYTKILMETLRQTFHDAGYLPHSWHGPGALARMALKRHNVYDAMAQSPIDVQLAARAAFIAGRFEGKLAGHIQGKVYSADIRSAYPFFATQLPNLAKGSWRRGRGYEPRKFAVYHISYRSKPDPYGLYPLPRRMSGGNVAWPYRVDGWFWSPEAELVKDDPDAVFLEALIFDEDNENDRPFAWLTEYYRRRSLLKRTGNPAQYTFKLIINSVYGQLAQRAGWDRKRRSAPRSHQLEWAGYITSACRAAVYRVAAGCGNKLVCIDTDSVTSLAPIDGLTNVSEELGAWELSEWDDGIFWQSGMYALNTGGEWKKARTRGIPRGEYSAQEMLTAFYAGEPLRIMKKTFVTYGLALQLGRDKLNTWITEPHEYAFGGNGKTFHSERGCCAGKPDTTVHRLAMLHMLYGPVISPVSEPHYLPWLDTEDLELERRKHKLDDWTWYDQNHLEEDEEWVRDYADPA